MGESRGLAFVDLSLSVSSFLKKNKTILNDITGSFDFGSLNGLMGTSGSGKTSLLKCLFGNNSEYVLDSKSKIYHNSKEVITSCFIPQDHNQRLLRGLTVRQSMIYASKLKNSDEFGVNHKIIVEKLLKEFLLSDTQNNSIENCSGGQLKRLTIALELTAQKKPNILLIDEPTSGLDSNSAEMVSIDKISY